MDTATYTSPADIDGPDQARPESHARDPAIWRMNMVEELAELGMALARASQQAAVNQMEEITAGLAEAGPMKSGPAHVFERTSRMIRQTLAIHARLERDDRLDRERSLAERLDRQAAEQARQERNRQARRESRRTVVEHLMEGVIREIDPSDAEDLYSDLYERLDDYETFLDFATVPISEMATRLCRDLNVKPNWRRWQDEPWAIEEMATKPPGSPYANWPPPDEPPEDETAQAIGPP